MSSDTPCVVCLQVFGLHPSRQCPDQYEHGRSSTHVPVIFGSPDSHAALGRPDLAHAELERAATDCQTLLGENHPDTVALRADLALLSRDGLGSVEPAET